MNARAVHPPVAIPRGQQGGALMIEVLVTISIMIIGLWGLMEVQIRLQQSEMESYQRTQALLLLDDMATRISANRKAAIEYLTDTYLGVGATCPGGGAGRLVERDKREWCERLQGAAETATAASASANVGAMVGGRGCVASLGADDDQLVVTVVWQGRSPVAAPPANITCASGLYNLPEGSQCAESDNADMCRRYVSTIVDIGTLTPPVAPP